MKKQEYKDHWQVDAPEQFDDNEPWKNVLQDLERALPLFERGGTQESSKQ